jgi:hypothetical protein
MIPTSHSAGSCCWFKSRVKINAGKLTASTLACLPSADTGRSTVAIHWRELLPMKISETDGDPVSSARRCDASPSAVRSPRGLDGGAAVFRRTFPSVSATMIQASPSATDALRASTSKASRSSASRAGERARTWARAT